MNKYYGNANISYNDIEGQLMPDESIIQMHYDQR